MARIVYGVSGEGGGHSSRSGEVLRDLIAHGHEVKVATYARGIDNLANDFDVIEIAGLTIVSRDNRVSRLATVTENLSRTAQLARGWRRLRNEGFRTFDPDVVITDFEPMTAYLAGFIGDLVAAKGVIATAGFTLISESLYLGKPYLALPTTGQFEQQLNAWQLAQSGYGVIANDGLYASVAGFIAGIERLSASRTRRAMTAASCATRFSSW